MTSNPLRVPSQKFFFKGLHATLLLMLMAAMLGASAAFAQEIDTVLQKYRDDFAKQDALEENALGPAREGYLRELAKLRDTAKGKGDLDGVMAAEAMIAAEQGTGARPNVVPASLLQTRTNFEKARAVALRKHAASRQRLEAEFERALTDLEQKHTRAGDLEAAKAVRDRRATIEFTRIDILPTMTGEAQLQGGLTIVKDKAAVTSQHAYAAPVEITYVFMTTSQVRLGYAADEIILNWEADRAQLRIDGGPASGKHVNKAGAIEKNKWVTVKQIVRGDEMELFVNGERRARWNADFSAVNSPIRIRPAFGTLTVKQVLVKKLAGNR